MEEPRYMPRLIDSEIERMLEAFGAVLLEGPEHCGKTTSAERLAASALYMLDRDRAEDYRQIARLKTSNLLVGDKPRLIDEWQTAPKLWGAVRHDVDMQSRSGLYILTGSHSVDERTLPHSGAGRIARLRMRTMSLLESGDSTGEVSLSGLLTGADDVDGISRLDYGGLAGVLARGGWPTAVLAGPEGAKDVVAGCCADILAASPDGVRRDPGRMGDVLASLARCESTAASRASVARDMAAHGRPVSPDTLSGYVGALRAEHVVDDLPAWMPRLRTGTTVRSGGSRHLCDPSVAAHVLGKGPWDLEMDPRTFERLFASMAVRDVRVYAQGLRGRVHHYRDEDGLEADMVVQTRDGRWGAMGVALGPDRVDPAARDLLRLRDKVDAEAMNKPSFLAVVTGTGFAYTREDGVHVVPLGCLGP